MKKETFSIKSKHGWDLVGDRYHEDDDKVIILIYGYGSNRKRPGPTRLLETLTNEGHDCISFDLSGSGDSGGDFGEMTISQWIEDVLSIISFTESKGYKHIALVGTSAGGVIAMGAALRYPVERLFLRAPASDYPNQRLRKYGQSYIDKWKETGHTEYTNGEGRVLKIAHNFIVDAEKHIMRKRAENITCPTLIIHGDKDKDVFLDYSEKLIKHIPNATLLVIEGAGHNGSVDGDFTISIEALKDWFKEW